MPDRFLNNPLANISGGTTVILSIWMKSMEWFNIADFSDLLVIITSIGSIIFLVFKVISLRKDIKLKDLEIKQKTKDLNKD